jgi:hypothetical protein
MKTSQSPAMLRHEDRKVQKLIDRIIAAKAAKTKSLPKSA